MFCLAFMKSVEIKIKVVFNFENYLVIYIVKYVRTLKYFDKSGENIIERFFFKPENTKHTYVLMLIQKCFQFDKMLLFKTLLSI